MQSVAKIMERGDVKPQYWSTKIAIDNRISSIISNSIDEFYT